MNGHFAGVSSATTATASNSRSDVRSSQLHGEAVGPGQQLPVHDWHGWVVSQGWSGREEVQRQQLLEWFGATPADPLPGSEGG